MLSNSFQMALKRLFTLFCGQEAWLCWTISKESSLKTTAHDSSEATLEERVLLRQLAFDELGKAIPGPHHAIFQLSSVNCILDSRTTVFHRFSIQDQVIIIACADELLPSGTILTALLQDQWKESITRQHLAKHLAQQEERIEHAETRLADYQNNWKKQVNQLLESWRQLQAPFSIEFDADLADCFLDEFDTHTISAQLDASLALQQFIQPAATHFYLSKTSLTTIDQPAATPSASLTSNQRAAILLDKYEESARAAQRKGITVSGKTIAEHLQPSISPPAITDALKKNRKAISALIHQHPEKWLLLRKYLKPVKELHERGGVQLTMVN